MTTVAIELVDVFCVHRTDEGDAAALQGLTLTAFAGELLAVLGPSGAGKSTLLRLVAGLETPSVGVVNVLGQDVGRLGERARARFRHASVGFLGQRSADSLPPALPIERAVMLPLALRGASRSVQRARAAELMGAAGLDHRAGALPDQLSGGERQRAALCMAVAHRPALLLADEPTGELDHVAGAAVLSLIGALAREHRTTAVVVSHDPVTASVADRVVRIRDGRVVEECDADGGGGVVVARGGWVHLPPELVRAARIRARVTIGHSGDGLVVAPAGDPPEQPEPDTPAADSAPPTWSPATIRTRALSRTRGTGATGREVIRSFTDVLGPGTMIAVAGRSGSGKTTLLRILAGLDRPDHGEVELDDVRLDRCSAERLAGVRRDRIGYLPQEPEPIGFLSAVENVRLALALHGWDGEAADERALSALARVDLAGYADQRVGRLSAGERQRVALARAMATARGLLIVDEPTSRLDEANAAAVADLLASAANEDRQTVVCATHDPQVLRRAGRVIDLDSLNESRPESAKI
jgi:ABC-type lipoprotein export system ATPase subunit